MKIQLTDWNIVNMNFSLLEETELRDENSFNLESGNFFSDDDKSFTVYFEITLNDEKFDLFVEAVFNFITDSAIDEEFKLSAFPKINAPAIAFPYIRAFISNLTLQSGLNPVILPSINFVKISEDKKNT